MPTNNSAITTLTESAQEQLTGGSKPLFAGNIGYTQALFREVDGVAAPVWHIENGYAPSYWGEVTAQNAKIYGP